jgi:hypothetical protein
MRHYRKQQNNKTNRRIVLAVAKTNKANRQLFQQLQKQTNKGIIKRLKLVFKPLFL